MSENNLPMTTELGALAELTVKDRQKLQKFIEDGLPGIATIEDSKIHTMFEMYLAGNTFSQISSYMRVKKEIVIFLSHKLSWFESKMEHLEDIQDSLGKRLTEDRIRSKDFALFVAQNWRRLVTGKLGEYLRTGNEALLQGIDLKEMEKYNKLVDSLHNAPKAPQAKVPAVGINVGAGVTITKKDDQTVEVTPTADLTEKEAAKALIEATARGRREEEALAKKKK